MLVTDCTYEPMLVTKTRSNFRSVSYHCHFSLLMISRIIRTTRRINLHLTGFRNLVLLICPLLLHGHHTFTRYFLFILEAFVQQQIPEYNLNLSYQRFFPCGNISAIVICNFRECKKVLKNKITNTLMRITLLWLWGLQGISVADGTHHISKKPALTFKRFFTMATKRVATDADVKQVVTEHWFLPFGHRSLGPAVRQKP
jgi:hypothetical protein